MDTDFSGLQLIVLLVVVPLAVFVIIALAVLAPGWTRAGAYRPGEPWDYEPMVISPGATGDIQRELTSTHIGELSSSELWDGDPGTAGEGGASARW